MSEAVTAIPSNHPFTDITGYRPRYASVMCDKMRQRGKCQHLVILKKKSKNCLFNCARCMKYERCWYSVDGTWIWCVNIFLFM